MFHKYIDMYVTISFKLKIRHFNVLQSDFQTVTHFTDKRFESLAKQARVNGENGIKPIVT